MTFPLPYNAKATAMTYIASSLKTLAFEAAKVYIGQPRAVLESIVLLGGGAAVSLIVETPELEPSLATKTLVLETTGRTLRHETVLVHVAYSGLCEVI